MKKIYLIITSMMLLLFLVACLPPTDKTTEYKEKNDEFKKHILEKLSNNINEKKYARITRGFGISGNDELSIYKYEKSIYFITGEHFKCRCVCAISR